MNNNTVAGKNVVIYAPNINRGGGLVLLIDLLEAVSKRVRVAFLDRRIIGRMQESSAILYVRNKVFSRFWAEWQLFRICTKYDLVLCFHGLPPLFPVKGEVIVYMQNSLLLGSAHPKSQNVKTRLKMELERFWLRIFSGHAKKYIVQTLSMEISLKKTLGGKSKVFVYPFVDAQCSKLTTNFCPTPKKYDFIYVASGEAHKNHKMLINAWEILARDGIRPTLVLTLDFQENSELLNYISKHRQQFNLNIINLGWLQRKEVLELYNHSRAMIFPSLNESLGLPLIEASYKGLPIIAPELDYIRDVIEPIATFDPHSPLSMARAIKRFLGHEYPIQKLGIAKDFTSEFLQ